MYNGRTVRPTAHKQHDAIQEEVRNAMNKSVSPGVVVAVIVIVLLVIAAVGWKIFGPQTVRDTLSPEEKQKKMQEYYSRSGASEEMKHQMGTPGIPVGAQPSGGGGR